jgi:hypothetical protein
VDEYIEALAGLDGSLDSSPCRLVGLDVELDGRISTEWSNAY